MKKRIEQYVLEEQIGSGSYGAVFRGYDERRVGGEQVAIKVIGLQQVEQNQKIYEFIFQEIEMLKQVNHKNVVKFIEVLKTWNNYYMVYEYADQGSLEDFMKERRRIGDEEVEWVVEQLLEAFLALDSLGIIHRDIKLQNILVTSCTHHPSGFKLLLADFGFSKQMTHLMSQSQLGTPLYMCPQMLRNQPYDKTCDVWSMGVMLYALIERRPLFDSPSIPHLLHLIHHQLSDLVQFHSPYVSQQYLHFVKTCLQVSNRPNWQQLYHIYQNTCKRGGGGGGGGGDHLNQIKSLLLSYFQLQQQKKDFIQLTIANLQHQHTNYILQQININLVNKLKDNIKHNMENILQILLLSQPELNTKVDQQMVEKVQQSKEVSEFICKLEMESTNEEKRKRIDYRGALDYVRTLSREGEERMALRVLVCLQVDQGIEDTYLIQAMHRLDLQLIKTILHTNLYSIRYT